MEEFLTGQIERLGYLFYVMNPSKHCFEKLEDVKNYYKEVTPLLLVTVWLEQVIRYLQNKPLWRYNDTICNTFHGVLMEISKIPLWGAEVWVYAWIYKNYRLIELPWDSPYTWIFCWFVTDFCYYWMHRMIHQVNILWAIHEAHHTAEDMMFTSPMRNHVLYLPTHWLTYLPMALAIPPTTYLVHYQISIIYQYWLHSEIIGKLPAPMEYIMCTPSHHRGHHGRNRRYIDKNFGSFLIIWDRIFGTFEEEDVNEKPLYGTTSQMKSFNPLVIQTSHFRTVWRRFQQYDNWRDKLSAVFKGPGWSLGKPWTGNIEDIPHPAPAFDKYHPVLPIWRVWYVKIHFFLFLLAYFQFALNMTLLSKVTIFAVGCFITFSTITIGFLLDKSSYGPPLEFLRCLLYFVVDKVIYFEVQTHGIMPVITIFFSRVTFVLSILVWIGSVLYEQLRVLYKEKAV